MYQRLAFASVTLVWAAIVAAQPPASGDVPRAQYIAVQDGEFRKMDANKDGQVTKTEVEDFQRLTSVAESQARNRQLFAQLDADHNGQLSPAEFAKVEAPTPPVNGQPVIAQLDLNKDGKVSLVEYRTAKLASFDRIDTDKDGVVTVAEMRAAGVIK